MFNKPKITLAGILVAAALVYLIGNGSVSLWDRDEPRYAQTSRQMLQSGDWVVPRLLDEVRTAKPILIYWCQAASMRLFGDTDYAARLPSVVAMLITLLILSAVLWRTVGAQQTVLTILILSSAGLSIGAAKMCMTDAVLLVFITVAQLCLFRAWSHGFSWLIMIVMGIAVGFASLTKGPVVLGVMIMTLLALGFLRTIDIYRAIRLAEPHHGRANAWGLALRRSFRYGLDQSPASSMVKIVVMLLIAFAINAPWLYLVNSREPNFLPTIIGHDVVSRMITPLENHKGPPGYYLLTIWLIYLPWSLLLPATFIVAWVNRDDPRIRFALAAIVGPWLMFEIVQTKLPHYILPTFPALAFLTADMWIRRGKSARQPLIMATAIFLVVAVVYGLILPQITQLRVSIRTAQALINQGATHLGDVMMIDYKEPSLGFYQGGTIREQRDNQFLQNTLPSQWPKWIVLTTEVWKGVPPEIKDQLEIVSSVEGRDLADHFRLVDVMVVKKK